MQPDDVLALSIPIIGIIGSCIVVIVIVLASLHNRRIRHEMLHKERMMALEKGLPIPVDYYGRDYGDQPARRRPFLSGLIWGGIGLAVVLWGAIEGEDDMNAWGLIPLFVGIALIIGDWIALRREKKHNDAAAFPPADSGYRAPDNRS